MGITRLRSLQSLSDVSPTGLSPSGNNFPPGRRHDRIDRWTGPAAGRMSVDIIGCSLYGITRMSSWMNPQYPESVGASTFSAQSPSHRFVLSGREWNLAKWCWKG